MTYALALADLVGGNVATEIYKLIDDNKALQAELAALRAEPDVTGEAWKKLTDVEWMNIVNKHHAWQDYRPDDVAHEVCKLTEEKLREKNAPTQSAVPLTEKVIPNMRQELENMGRQKLIDQDIFVAMRGERDALKQELTQANTERLKWKEWTEKAEQELAQTQRTALEAIAEAMLVPALKQELEAAKGQLGQTVNEREHYRLERDALQAKLDATTKELYLCRADYMAAGAQGTAK